MKNFLTFLIRFIITIIIFMASFACSCAIMALLCIPLTIYASPSQSDLNIIHGVVTVITFLVITNDKDIVRILK